MRSFPFRVTSVAAVALFACSATAAVNVVNTVTLAPPAPTAADPITVHADGVMPSGGVRIKGSEFLIDGTDPHQLFVNVHAEIGDLTVITPWSYDRLIGPLSAGTYDLTVRAFDDRPFRGGDPPGGPLQMGERSISFTVLPAPAVPEPAGACLFAATGAALLLRRRQR